MCLLKIFYFKAKTFANWTFWNLNKLISSVQVSELNHIFYKIHFRFYLSVLFYGVLMIPKLLFNTSSILQIYVLWIWHMSIKWCKMTAGGKPDTRMCIHCLSLMSRVRIICIFIHLKCCISYSKAEFTVNSWSWKQTRSPTISWLLSWSFWSYYTIFIYSQDFRI